MKLREYKAFREDMAAITFTDEDISNITFDFDDNFAEGGLADIYKGFWGGREIAVKEYAQIHKQTWKVEKDFLLRLRHPNIIHLIGWNEQLNVSFLVLEYVESTLELKIPELDWPSTLKVIKQAAGAIGYINGNGIVIGDFKPNNILIDQGKNIKLIDFGSARFGDGYMAKKNDSYAAPEIIKANSNNASMCAGVQPYMVGNPSAFASSNSAIISRIPGGSLIFSNTLPGSL
ncbi:hypothetical protein RJ639_008324 [Escallonia herrerae]|uniref:Protein kinase domain-containing protein n=1 Tax=Escallonia herrerae TaxID=1293975 RepID=A0AA88VQ09_9ASTE|nr:hypothetical protein RJ639_008324 [Escallonia herrerae]